LWCSAGFKRTTALLIQSTLLIQSISASAASCSSCDLVSACCGSFPAAGDVCSSTQHRCGNPDKHQFGAEDLQASGAEKRPDTDGRDAHRAPGEKIACRVERREEGNPSPAVRHGVEYPV